MLPKVPFLVPVLLSDGWLDVTDLTPPTSPSDLQKSTERGCLVVQGTHRAGMPLVTIFPDSTRRVKAHHHQAWSSNIHAPLQHIKRKARQPWVAHHKGEKRETLDRFLSGSLLEGVKKASET